MQNYTLVTGASTGIGRSIVEELIQKNHIVFAGARKSKDLESLNGLGDRVIAIELDVTKPEQIRQALAQIKSRLPKDHRFNLVNNAGIVAPGPIEGLRAEDLRYQFEVNVFGVVSVTQVFLPLIRLNKGKIVMISSISGIVSVPFLGAYSASKFALEAISDSLRLELKPSGVGVFVIQPGPIATPIWEKNITREQEMLADIPDSIREIYKDPIEKFLKRTKKDVHAAIPAETVARAVSDCFNQPSPPLRKIVAAKSVKALIQVARLLPTGLLDEQLIKNYNLSCD